jgi:hypothetical protein
MLATFDVSPLIPWPLLSKTTTILDNWRCPGTCWIGGCGKEPRKHNVQVFAVHRTLHCAGSVTRAGPHRTLPSAHFTTSCGPQDFLCQRNSGHETVRRDAPKRAGGTLPHNSNYFGSSGRASSVNFGFGAIRGCGLGDATRASGPKSVALANETDWANTTTLWKP